MAFVAGVYYNPNITEERLALGYVDRSWAWSRYDACLMN